MLQSLPYRIYRPYELPKIQKQHRYRILIMDKDLLNMIKEIHVIIDSYLKKKNMSHVKIDVDPIYLE